MSRVILAPTDYEKKFLMAGMRPSDIMEVARAGMDFYEHQRGIEVNRMKSRISEMENKLEASHHCHQQASTHYKSHIAKLQLENEILKRKEARNDVMADGPKSFPFALQDHGDGQEAAATEAPTEPVQGVAEVPAAVGEGLSRQTATPPISTEHIHNQASEDKLGSDLVQVFNNEPLYSAPVTDQAGAVGSSQTEKRTPPALNMGSHGIDHLRREIFKRETNISEEEMQRREAEAELEAERYDSSPSPVSCYDVASFLSSRPSTWAEASATTNAWQEASGTRCREEHHASGDSMPIGFEASDLDTTQDAGLASFPQNAPRARSTSLSDYTDINDFL